MALHLSRITGSNPTKLFQIEKIWTTNLRDAKVPVVNLHRSIMALISIVTLESISAKLMTRARARLRTRPRGGAVRVSERAGAGEWLRERASASRFSKSKYVEKAWGSSSSGGAAGCRGDAILVTEPASTPSGAAAAAATGRVGGRGPNPEPQPPPPAQRRFGRLLHRRLRVVVR